MAEEKKTIDSAVLEEVQGGLAAAYRVLKQDVQAMIPYAVKEKLSTAKSDADARRILSDNGVDLAAINQKIVFCRSVMNLDHHDSSSSLGFL